MTRKKTRSVIRIISVILIAIGLGPGLIALYAWLASDHFATLVIYNHTNDEMTILYRERSFVVKSNTYCIITGPEVWIVITVLRADSERRYGWSPSTKWPYFFRGKMASQLEPDGKLYQVPIGNSPIDQVLPVEITADCIPISRVVD
jgi:hypothetical protein